MLKLKVKISIWSSIPNSQSNHKIPTLGSDDRRFFPTEITSHPPERGMKKEAKKIG